MTGTSAVPFLKKRMTHKLGWMAMLPSGETYNWFFENMDHLTNISYKAKFYGFKVRTARNPLEKQRPRQNYADCTDVSYFVFHHTQSDQYVIINHNFTQSPDRFDVIDSRNGSTSPLSFSNNENGDWYFDNSTNDLYYISKTKDVPTD